MFQNIPRVTPAGVLGGTSKGIFARTSERTLERFLEELQRYFFRGISEETLPQKFLQDILERFHRELLKVFLTELLKKFQK